MKRIALIPAYDPEDAMQNTVLELFEGGFTPIVINDGSDQKYDKLFSDVEAHAKVLTHDKNLGKGAALKTGLKYIKENIAPPYVVVTVDADGQHRSEDALRVTELAEKNPDALLLGSRILNSDSPLRSRLGNGITRFVFRASSGGNVYDTQTGLRAFTDRLTDKLLSIPGDRYEYEMNTLMYLTKDKTQIIEHPIKTVYINGNSSSHFDTVKDSYRIYKEIIKFSASSFVSFLLDYGLFCLLNIITGAVIIPNITARVISSCANYTINKRLVFKSSDSLVKTAAGYFTLAAVILLFNTLIIKALCYIGLNALLAKIITEAVLFVVSWTVQHKIIFKRRTSK